MTLFGFGFLMAFLVFIAMLMIKFIYEFERAVVFRFGKLHSVRQPGIRFIIPGIETLVRVSIRVVALDIPTQDIITRDNVSVKVNAVVYYRVMDAEKAIIKVEDYFYATGQLAQTSLRSVLGQVELDELLSERDKINSELQKILDLRTDPWGIKVANVEIKHVDLPTDMQRAMAKQAEAERERRAKVINAEGEFQASTRLSEAAAIMEKTPAALTLRYLQTMREMSNEKSTTIIVPLPMDFIEPFMKTLGMRKEK
ncbi:MAG: slipin family protein [Nitrospinota bacterium]|nr:slipin family protein [Nitrospinota bacterium]MDH5678642.1 slipin family protein [Nitrospinota bacterium]MDH5757481.1 slipin family protein [Nitrospinota bacterium]